MKILVIEDDTFLSSLLSGELQQAGYEVLSANDGERGVEMAKKMPDLILLDLIMPGMDGFETLAKLKADPVTASIPVVVASNLGEPEEIKRAKDGGALDFLVKVHFTPKEIIEKIKTIVPEKK
ncbi:MAG: response regulator [Minisyncoccota bacterium]